MSLIMSFCTSHGIVMGADRCITTNLASGESFISTMHERKLFMTSNGFGIAYAGSSTFKDRPASYWIERFIPKLSVRSRSVSDLVYRLCLAFHRLDPDKSIIIIGSGYKDGNPQVFSCNSSKLKSCDHLNGKNDCIAFAGEVNLARCIIDAVPIARNTYTTLDAVDFIKHVILTTSNIQKFGQIPITVSPECDLLYIGEKISKWIEPPEFLV
ncbi:MAG: hypothetical protein IJP43_07640 [Oscillospiraceae bacterium]|nr:hypothetical protein [Oscillospiraceae bacterium]